MTTPPIFPVLPGQGWSVHKKPVFSTRVAAHPSGREVRAGLYAHALYEFELTFNGLDSSGAFPGLQSQSLQTLMGFFLSMGGQLNTFLYVDPTDNTATNQVIGTGDGSTTTFSLGRTLGGYYEPISYALTAAAPTEINYGAGVGLNYLPNNLISNSSCAGVVAGTPGTDPTGWAVVVDTAHGLAQQIVGTGLVNGLPYFDLRIYGTDTNSGGNLALNMGAPFTAAAGETIITSYSLALVAGTLPGAVKIGVKDGAAYEMLTVSPSAALTQFSETWTFANSGSTHAFLWVYGPTTSGTAVDFTLRIAAPQAQVVNPAVQTAQGPFLATNGAACYGSPLIMENGVAAASSSYSFTAPNTIAFTSAPAAGAVIAWSGTYAFQCRFLDDQWDFENFMSGLWQNKSVKFRSIR